MPGIGLGCRGWEALGRGASGQTTVVDRDDKQVGVTVLGEARASPSSLREGPGQHGGEGALG
jgi:hypothetical protein